MRILIISFLLLSASVIYGNTDSINCYIEIQDIYDLDYNKSSVKVDFFLVLEYSSLDSLGYSILNGTILEKELQHLDQPEKFFCERLVCELRINLDFNRFPLDRQNIDIQIEPNSYFENQVFYSKPLQNIFVGQTHLNGWDTKDISYTSSVKTYKIQEKNGVNFYKYQIANFTIPLYRKSTFLYFFKTFFPSILSILIIYIGFLFPLNVIEPKLNLSVGSLFVMISNLIVTQQLLPDISAITLIEKLNVISLITISITILYFALTYRYKDRFKGNVWARANLTFIISSLLLFVVLSMLVIF